MSITQQHIQELLHRAYVLAIAAEAGLNISLGSELDYGVDVTVGQVTDVTDALGVRRRIETGLDLKLQLKSTTNCRSNATHIQYDCEAPAYNKIVIQNLRGANPVLLVVFCMPTARADWLEVSEDTLTLRKACYWYYLRGPQTTQTSQVINIPRNQLFTPAALRGIISRIANGGTP
jgi:hypothetical protein